MARLFLGLFLFFWLLAAAAIWTLTVGKSGTAFQFAFLVVPPTAWIIFQILFFRRLES